MWLTNGLHRVLTTPQGGSVLGWQYGSNWILGPSRTEEIGGAFKVRGETHWCFPNFGKDPAGEFPPHGFLRETLLQPYSASPQSAAFSRQLQTSTATVRINNTVAVETDGIWMALSANVLGDGSLPILPALHPYFAVPLGGLTVTMNGRALASSGANGIFGVSAQAVSLKVESGLAVHLHGLGEVTFNSSGTFENIKVWSDQPEKYVCVEPVFGQLDSFRAPEGMYLRPRNYFNCVVSMQFKPEE